MTRNNLRGNWIQILFQDEKCLQNVYDIIMFLNSIMFI